MAVSPGTKLVLVLLLSCELLSSFPLDPCPEFCICQPFLHLNCSSAGLSMPPLKINPSITELDFSNNQLESLTFQSKYYNLQKVWLGNNSMSQLSLCVAMDLKGQSKSMLRGRWGCQLWAPTLWLLSVERNQLEKLPEGLGQQRSLQILHLSFNKISTLEQRDFSHLKQLEVLHLQHNLISSLHPQMFEKLDRLKVLDLSFNLLTTLHPVTYISLHHIGADVGLRGNSWICDCGMRFLQRQMVYDNSKGLKTWGIECASPMALSGMNLQELDKEYLDCQDLDIHQDVTVHRGSEILLTCSEPDAAWWTPNGEKTRGQEQGSLFITNITEEDEGLYVCLSKSHQILSFYNVQIHEQNRRSVSKDILSNVDKMVQTKTTVTQSHFAMAVSLSVIITFIIAFILGVLLQPYICACWQKIKTKKQKPQINSVPNAQQEQYDNDAYLHCEDVDDFEPHRERRVTFTEHTEEGNMQYYDTVAGDAQEGNGAVRGPGHAISDSSDDSGSENGKHNHRNVNNLGKEIEFEIIQNSAERNSISSQSSKSSVGDKILKNNCSTPNTTQAIEEQIQQTSIDVPQISIEKSNEIQGFISEPFADWSPHGNNISILDPDLDNGELFEYSDSVRSGSPISPHSSFKQPILNMPNVNKKISTESSSSSSDISDSEPTHYTVNPDSEEETDVFEKKVSTKSPSSSVDSETESHHAVETWPVVDLEHIPTIKRRLIFKTIFVNLYSIDMAMKNELPVIDQKPPTIKKRKAPLPPPRRKSSSSSSDSEDEIGKFKQEETQLEAKHNSKVVHLEKESQWPVVNLEHVRKVERRLDFKARDAGLESFSSRDSQEESIYEEIKERIPIYSNQDFTTVTNKHVSGTSSSSESDDERGIKEGKHYQENIHHTIQYTPNKQPIMMLEQESQWPVINLGKIPKIKQRLDIKDRVDEKEIHVHEKIPPTIIKAPQLESETSSSSESEDEHETNEVQENYYENIQLVTSQTKQPTVMLEQESQWPVINLAKIPKIKQRLDIKERGNEKVTHMQRKIPSTIIKVPRLESETSSSSESEDEHETKKVEEYYYENIQLVTSQTKQPTVMLEQESQWPVINLAKIPKIKQRLDIKERGNEKVTHVQGKIPSTIIKVPKLESGTSSSSESEDERKTTEVQVNYHENIQLVTSQTKQPTVMLEQESQWPVINLGKIPKIKQRLDFKERGHEKMTHMQGKIPSTIIKVPHLESGTSSSSESEDEQEVKVKQEILQHATSPVKPPTSVKPDLESQWPVIDLTRMPKIKRRLDITKKLHIVPVRVPSETAGNTKPDSGTSSSSESEDVQDEQEIKIKQHQEKIPTVTSSNMQPTDTQWPVIDLVKIPKVKRRLDIKERESVKVIQVTRVPSAILRVPESETSSSSESEDEQQIKVKQEILQPATSPIKPPTAVNQEPQWPVVNLVKAHKVKRRLDIRTVSAVESSSSSDSEDARTQERVPSTPVNVQKPQFDTSSSSESEDEQESAKVSKENLLQIAPPTEQQESKWPAINLVKIPKLKRRLDIKERVTVKMAKRPDRVPSTSSKVSKQYSGTSSSSESEEEQEIHVNRYENIQQITSPTKQLEPESQWPVINVVKIPKPKRRLDIKTITPDNFSSSSSDSEDEQVKVQGKLPLRPVNVKSVTSSSSESEDEHEIREIKQENLLVTSEYKQPIESQWPVIDLVKIPKVKRRLDIKERVTVKAAQLQERVPSTSIRIPKQDSVTSSSSESDDEHEIREIKLENLLVTSQYKQPIESQWPVIDLVKIPKVKRRLDIKERVTVKAAQLQERVPSTSIRIPKQDSVTSSSSESDDEQKIEVNHQAIIPPTMPPTVDSPWPMIDLVRIPKVKRRLDIKERVNVKVTQVPLRVPSETANVQRLQSDTSSSSESEDEEKVNQENLQQIVTLPTKQPAESQWPVINLALVPKLKRRLDIKTTVLETDSSSSDSEYEEVTMVQGKVPSTNITIPTLGTSFSSESDDETIQKVGVTTLGSKVEPQTQWPVVELGGVTRIKSRLDFKIPSQSLPLPVPASGGSSNLLVSSSSSSSDEDEKVVKSPQISAGQTTRSPSQTSLGIPHISRRLDIKGPSMKPGLQDSDSSSSSDDEKNKPELSSGSFKYQDNKDFIKASPILTMPRSPTKTTPGITLEKYTVVTDDLRDKATTGSTSSVVTPELQSKWATMNLGRSRFRKRLDITRTSSPKQDELISGIDMVKVTEQVSIAPTREQNVDSSSSSESEGDSKLDGESPMGNLTSIPQAKRYLNITTKKKKYSSSSSSDEDTVDMGVPDLSLGVPRIKRRLNIKAPTPPPSPSSCDDEKVYAHIFSDVTDQRSIEYKRTIMKSYSNDSYTTHRDIYRQPLYFESSPQTPKKLSLDNIKRKFMPSKQNELPPNLRWTSVGSHLSEHPVPVPKRQHDGFTSPRPMSPPPPISNDTTSDSSSSEDEQKELETTVIVTRKTYSPRTVTFNTSPTILNAATFEEGTERRGLRALKAMSSDRKNWESEYETFTESVPVSVDYAPEHHTVYRRTVDFKTKISQPLTYSTISPTSEERSRADMMYGIPSYKRHTIKSTELPQGPPPPVPSTPLPEESTDFTWRSPQTSLSRGSLSYVQKKTTEEESVDDPFYDNPNISAV